MVHVLVQESRNIRSVSDVLYIRDHVAVKLISLALDLRTECRKTAKY